MSPEDTVFSALARSFANPDLSLGSTCVPRLTSISSYEKLLPFFKQKIAKSKDSAESFALDQMLVSAIFDLSQEKDRKFDMIKAQYRELLRPMYEEFRLRNAISRFFSVLDSLNGGGSALQYASLLGDPGAYSIAERAISDYLNGKSGDTSAFQQAVFAVDSFKTDDPSIISSRQILLKKVVSSSQTPDYVKEKIESSFSAQ